MTQPHVRVFRGIILPTMVLLPLIAVMVGCIYIPTWERVDLGDTRRDFRPIVKTTSKYPLLIGMTTRADIEKVLGPPPFSTLDGHHVVYVIEARRGFWTAPLCFFLLNRDAHTEQIGLDIDYRPNGILSSYRVIKREIDQGPPLPIDYWGDPFGGPTGDQTTIVRELNGLPVRGVASTAPLEMSSSEKPLPPEEILHPRPR